LIISSDVNADDNDRINHAWFSIDSGSKSLNINKMFVRTPAIRKLLLSLLLP